MSMVRDFARQSGGQARVYSGLATPPHARIFHFISAIPTTNYHRRMRGSWDDELLTAGCPLETKMLGNRTGTASSWRGRL